MQTNEIVVSEPETIGGDIAGMFSFLIDPRGAAKMLNKKWFWIFPLLLAGVMLAIYQVVQAPLMLQYLQNNPPANVPPDAFAKQLQFTTMLNHILPFIVPVFMAIFILIMAAILLGSSSVLGVKAKFGQLWNLMTGLALIGGIQALAWAGILKAKGEISSMQDAKPPTGLDIILPAGTNKFLVAAAGYFSIFTIWQIVMFVLIYSLAFRVSKGKAFAAYSPLLILGLLFTLVGAVFQK